MKLFATTAAFVLLSTGVSLAAVDTQALVSGLQADGYTHIEVKTGVSQVKIEAVRGTEKVEVIYDNATGAVLKSETEAVRPGEDTSVGVSFDTRDDDFVEGGRSGRGGLDDTGDSYDDSDGRADDRSDDRNDDRGDDRGGDRDGDRDGDRGGDDHGGDRGGDRGGDSSDD